MKTIHLAGCIIQDNNSRILLLHRNTAKRIQWEIPGGKIEKDEHPADTAKREIFEELGIEVEIVHKLGTKAFTEDTHVMKYTWFSARVISGTPKIMEPNNHDAWRYFSLAELKKLTPELSPNAVNFLRVQNEQLYL